MIGYYELPYPQITRFPLGRGVTVCQVEASVGGVFTKRDYSSGDWLPDVNLAEFDGKTFLPYTPMPARDNFSRHATSVGRLFYGREHSIAPGIAEIHNYEASNWLVRVLRAGQPRLPKSPGCRIVNHSWIAQTQSTVLNGDILRRTDWLSEHAPLLEVVGIGNEKTNRPLLGSAYNVISVGRTDGHHGIGTVAVDPVYDAGRAQPLIVAPMSTVSAAVPVVAAAAAVLIDLARQVNAPANNDVIKAALMAGADRHTDNGTGAEIHDYRLRAEDRTDNGLDRRYGAGQVNIANSYAIIAAGQFSGMDRPASKRKAIAPTGFDNVAHFGGARGVPRELDYPIGDVPPHHKLATALVWDLDVEPARNGVGWRTRLNHLDLSLYDETSGRAVAWSDSRGQNTENLYMDLVAGHQYRLRVMTTANEPDFDGRYALAWRVFDSRRVPATNGLWILPVIALVVLSVGLVSRSRPGA